MRTLHAVVIALLTSPLAMEAGAAEPSFDCTKASGEAEQAICASETLASLDRTMAETYRAARDSLAGAADAKAATDLLTSTQRGWIKGRNECWKADDLESCIADSYTSRIAEMQARYVLIPGSAPVFFGCDGNPANEVVATFFEGERGSVRLERGDSTEIGVADPNEPGRYVAGFGVEALFDGDVALVEWPQGTTLECVEQD